MHDSSVRILLIYWHLLRFNVFLQQTRYFHTQTMIYSKDRKFHVHMIDIDQYLTEMALA